ncbi:MAG: glycosyltransferase [Chloroflexi bacterium]|nr:MAG: glycosyltransferase [Chloroflexota bacterium]
MTGAGSTTPRANILGVGIHPITMKETVARLSGWIDARQRCYVSACTVHTVMECRRSPAMRHAVNGAGLAVPDGMPLVWLARRLSGVDVSRVYGPDLLLEMCARSVTAGYSHYFYGGAPGVAAALAQTMQQKFPGLRVAGHYSPPYRPAHTPEEPAVIEQINTAAPDIIWVGLGTPKQDLWMADHRAALDAPVLAGVGAAFDFFTGRVAQAPRWMQRSGLEWLFRLSQEPRRLWYRYLVYNPLFVALVALQLAGLKKYPPPAGS